MYKIVYVNEKGRSIEFTSSPPFRLLKDPEGLGGLNIDINSSKSPFQNGYTYLNSTTDARRIMFDILIQDDNIPARRREISKTINPFCEGTVKHIYGNEIKELKCKVEKPPKFLNSPSHPSDRFQVCQFTLVCPQPFWEESVVNTKVLKAFVPMFKFPFKFPVKFGGQGDRVIVQNNGDVPTPIKITFKGAVLNPLIKNETTGEMIRLKKELKEDDVLTITTEFGNKRVEINGENGYSYLDSPVSTFWNLQEGENIVSYTADEGATNGELIIEYKNRYLGI